MGTGGANPPPGKLGWAQGFCIFAEQERLRAHVWNLGQTGSNTDLNSNAHAICGPFSASQRGSPNTFQLLNLRFVTHIKKLAMNWGKASLVSFGSF